MAATITSLVGLGAAILGLVKQINDLVDRESLVRYQTDRTANHVECVVEVLEERYRASGGRGSGDTIRSRPPGVSSAIAWFG